jgi:hypothetical protein
MLSIRASTLRNRCLLSVLSCCLAGTLPQLPHAAAQDHDEPSTPEEIQVPADASEKDLIAEIVDLTASLDTPTPTPDAFLKLSNRKIKALAHINALLERFPDTSFRTEALILKLSLLRDLARLQEPFLGELLRLTQQLSRQDLPARLAEENAYSELQAFVLGARLEDMPAPTRLRGTAERYQAFLEDYPNSPREPVIRASLVRTLIGLGALDDAKRQLGVLRRRHPDHPATKRAAGEVWRMTAVGQPVNITHTMPDGSVLNTKDAAGKVIVLHLWSLGTRESSLASLARLLKLREANQQRPLQIIGVNLDADAPGNPIQSLAREILRERDIDWPQYFDSAGEESDLLVKLGVTRLPAYFIIDSKGILRGTDPGDALEPLVDLLLTEAEERKRPVEP